MKGIEKKDIGMDRRDFLQLGLAGAAFSLPGCTLRLCGGGVGGHACGEKEEKSEIRRVDTLNTRVKVYYNADTVAILSPAFHLLTRYKRRRVFANLPDTLLQKAYLKYGGEQNRDLVFRVYRHARQTSWSLNLLWRDSELNPQERQLLAQLVSEQAQTIGSWVHWSIHYQMTIYQGKSADAYNIGSNSHYDSGIDMDKRTAALRNGAETVYQLRQYAGATISAQSPMAQIYTAGSYPDGFFDTARAAIYQPGTTDEAAKTYPWQTRKSPISIDTQGRVSVQGRILHHLNARSPYA